MYNNLQGHIKMHDAHYLKALYSLTLVFHIVNHI